ncbi:PatB family C-S lyase [Paracoccaceae bacterium]|nr:PatB family C-S lyase [Paracoccaceae bacterium]
MIVNFDKYIDNRNANLSKFEGLRSLYNTSQDTCISMWVADMDFNPPQSVIKALQKEVTHGVFGYYGSNKSFINSVKMWMKSRHDWDISEEWCSVVHGVNSGIGIGLRAFSEPGDEILLFSPIYYSFFNTIKNNGRVAKEIPLKIVEDHYEVDFHEMDKNLSGKERIIIFCSPHNPGGRVWSKETLASLAEYSRKNNILIFMDEIHHDLTYPDKPHTTFLKAAPEAEEITLVFTAATKTFNIAGCHTGTTIIPNPKLRAIYDREHAAFGKTPNRFGMIMTEAAYREGAEWLDQLMRYLENNKRIFTSALKALNKVKVFDLESTYLAWVDFSSLDITEKELKNALVKKAGIAPSFGSGFGKTSGHFARFNIACRKEILELAVDRLTKTFL